MIYHLVVLVVDVVDVDANVDVDVVVVVMKRLNTRLGHNFQVVDPTTGDIVFSNRGIV